MSLRKKVVFLNDKPLYNERYRSSLMEFFSKNCYEVKSLSLFSGGRVSFSAYVKFAISRYPVISSNIKSNIMALTAPWLGGMVILNGLGRYRPYRSFRWVIGVLLKLNVKKNVAIQSYADYRYYRRFFLSKRIGWFPGSGGREKPHGDRDGYILVQRDDKIKLVANDLNNLFDREGCGSVSIVGCKREDSVSQYCNFAAESLGFLDSFEILRYGKVFVQPSGYGEGFPHSLADAIVSNMDIVISKNEYIRSGLWRVGADKVFYHEGWVKLVYGESVGAILTAHSMAVKYYSFFVSEFDK
ncbi:hypothetical protein [Onishia taeanensis]